MPSVVLSGVASDASVVFNSHSFLVSADIFVRELIALDKPKHRFIGHCEEVTCLAVCPTNESVFASGSLVRASLPGFLHASSNSSADYDYI